MARSQIKSLYGAEVTHSAFKVCPILLEEVSLSNSTAAADGKRQRHGQSLCLITDQILALSTRLLDCVTVWAETKTQLVVVEKDRRVGWIISSTRHGATFLVRTVPNDIVNRSPAPRTRFGEEHLRWPPAGFRKRSSVVICLSMVAGSWARKVTGEITKPRSSMLNRLLSLTTHWAHSLWKASLQDEAGTSTYFHLPVPPQS
jgi:hypothetical protein